MKEIDTELIAIASEALQKEVEKDLKADTEELSIAELLEDK